MLRTRVAMPVVGEMRRSNFAAKQSIGCFDKVYNLLLRLTLRNSGAVRSWRLRRLILALALPR